MSVLGAAAIAAPYTTSAQEHNALEGLEPVLSSVSGLTLKGSIGAEYGISDGTRNRGPGLGKSENYHTFNLAYLRLGVEATVYDDFHFDTVLSILPSSGNIVNDLGGRQGVISPGVNLHRATLTYTGFDVTNLTFGHAHPRFGMEAYRADEDLYTITRSLLSAALGPLQHTGLWAHGEWDIFDYHVGIYNHDSFGGTNYSGAYPVGYLFNLSAGADLDEYARALHEDLSVRVRADFIYNDEAGATLGENREPYKNAYALGANVGFMGLNVAYEYIWARATNVAGFPNRPRARGYYLMPSYFVTDEFEVVVRYERMRNTEGNAGAAALFHNHYAADVVGIEQPGNKYQAIYFGGNYYLYGDNVKIMGGVEFAELKGDTAGTGNFQSRSQTAMTALRMMF